MKNDYWVNINELGTALLWELAYELGLHPRRVLHCKGVRWMTPEESAKAKGWTRRYEPKKVVLTPTEP